MKFGDIAVADAEGAILAHSVRRGRLSLKKGRILSAEDVAALREADVETVVGAQLEDGDVGEDAAAARIAKAAMGDDLDVSAAFTGRVNFYAKAEGLVVYDTERLNALNLIDESATVALLPPYTPVSPRQMVGTVKIIPFSAPEEVVVACEAVAAGNHPLVRVAPFRGRPVGLVQTRLPGTKESVLDKTTDVLTQRLTALGGTLNGERRCGHTADEVEAAIRALQDAGSEMILIIGASAITDRRDVVPSGIVRAGGAVDHFGMPVDPGNLMLIGHIGEMPVAGLPGCARSPKLNGFDWVLQRLFADIPVRREDIMVMGAGGLLKEIPARPLPRAEAIANPPEEDGMARAPRIAALILAAGQSRRMGATNKLLAEIDGRAMVNRVVDTVRASKAEPITVVLGHEAQRVRDAIGKSGDLSFVENPRYAEGLSTSLIRGIDALPADIDGVIVCLGDMPRVSPDVIDRLIAAFDPLEGRAICVATHNGKRGNPMLFARRFFDEVREISGDLGARHLTGAYPELTCDVEMSGDGVLLDIDTPDALAKLTA
jgi:molybdenum cofactor cytidylyltransferase